MGLNGAAGRSPERPIQIAPALPLRKTPPPADVGAMSSVPQAVRTAPALRQVRSTGWRYAGPLAGLAVLSMAILALTSKPTLTALVLAVGIGVLVGVPLVRTRQAHAEASAAADSAPSPAEFGPGRTDPVGLSLKPVNTGGNVTVLSRAGTADRARADAPLVKPSASSTVESPPRGPAAHLVQASATSTVEPVPLQPTVHVVESSAGSRVEPVAVQPAARVVQPPVPPLAEQSTARLAEPGAAAPEAAPARLQRLAAEAPVAGEADSNPGWSNTVTRITELQRPVRTGRRQ